MKEFTFVDGLLIGALVSILVAVLISWIYEAWSEKRKKREELLDRLRDVEDHVEDVRWHEIPDMKVEIDRLEYRLTKLEGGQADEGMDQQDQ